MIDTFVILMTRQKQKWLYGRQHQGTAVFKSEKEARAEMAAIFGGKLEAKKLLGVQWEVIPFR